VDVVLDTASTLQSFVWAFTSIYILLIFGWVLLSWVRIPYSRTFAAVQEFLDEVVRPYIRLFRRLPTLGPIDLSPIVAVVALLLAARLVNALIGTLL
jgi:YggT family protein